MSPALIADSRPSKFPSSRASSASSSSSSFTAHNVLSSHHNYHQSSSSSTSSYSLLKDACTSLSASGFRSPMTVSSSAKMSSTPPPTPSSPTPSTLPLHDSLSRFRAYRRQMADRHETAAVPGGCCHLANNDEFDDIWTSSSATSSPLSTGAPDDDEVRGLLETGSCFERSKYGGEGLDEEIEDGGSIDVDDVDIWTPVVSTPSPQPADVEYCAPPSFSQPTGLAPPGDVKRPSLDFDKMQVRNFSSSLFCMSLERKSKISSTFI